MRRIEELLGLQIDGKEVSQLIESSDEEVSVSEMAGEYYLRIESQGISLTAEDTGVVSTVHILPNFFDDCRFYDRDIPGLVRYGLKREEIHDLLGSPTSSASGVRVPVLGTIAQWDRFDLDAYSIHLQYSKEGEVDRITIMIPDAAGS